MAEPSNEIDDLAKARTDGENAEETQEGIEELHQRGYVRYVNEDHWKTIYSSSKCKY